MAIITLKEYAERLGKNPVVVRNKALRGGFKTAHKIGRDWMIDEDEPYIDLRTKSGKYVDWRSADGRRKVRKKRKEIQAIPYEEAKKRVDAVIDSYLKVAYTAQEYDELQDVIKKILNAKTYNEMDDLTEKAIEYVTRKKEAN